MTPDSCQALLFNNNSNDGDGHSGQEEPHDTLHHLDATDFLLTTPRPLMSNTPNPAFNKLPLPKPTAFVFDNVHFCPLLPDMIPSDTEEEEPTVGRRRATRPTFRVQPRFAALRTIPMPGPLVVLDTVVSSEEEEDEDKQEETPTTLQDTPRFLLDAHDNSALDDSDDNDDNDTLASLSSMEVTRQERWESSSITKVLPKKKNRALSVKHHVTAELPVLRTQPRRNSFGAHAA